MDITRWPTPKSDWLYSLQVKMEKGYTVSKTRPGSDCGSDHKQLIGKFKLEMKKLGKTIGPVRYELNEIPYDYTVEVTNRFKGLDLVDRVLKNYGWRFVTLYGKWWPNYLQEKEMQEGKGLSEEALQIANKRREAKGKGERESLEISSRKLEVPNHCRCWLQPWN